MEEGLDLTARYCSRLDTNNEGFRHVACPMPTSA